MWNCQQESLEGLSQTPQTTENTVDSLSAATSFTALSNGLLKL